MLCSLPNLLVPMSEQSSEMGGPGGPELWWHLGLFSHDSFLAFGTVMAIKLQVKLLSDTGIESVTFLVSYVRRVVA